MDQAAKNKTRAATFSHRRRSLSAIKSKLNRPHRGEAFSQSPDWRSYTFGPGKHQGNYEIMPRRVLPAGLYGAEIAPNTQAICWDRGRPRPQWARSAKMDFLRKTARLRAGRPRSQQITWTVSRVDFGVLKPRRDALQLVFWKLFETARPWKAWEEKLWRRRRSWLL